MVTMAVAGVSGRMGRMLVDRIDATEGATLAAVLERPGHDWIDADLGTALGGRPRGLVVGSDTDAALDAAEVLVDFTAPAATVAFAQAAARLGRGHVIGTTGFAPGDIEAIDAAAAAGATIVRAGNMSLGVNLLARVVEQVARALGEGFDIEIVEAHHRHKVDAPSGTALMLGEAAARGRGVSLDAVADRGRDGMTGARRPGAIGFAAIRGGDIVGEHEVMFAGEGETIALSHRATDRGLFARGAVRAALWAADRPAGHYDMMDVLGLN
ncbi:4-hydroxy-tetrahydrodipicolinate reductase [Palleronia sediminis]|uniref:4-hydroxy-tetrahydrodipicolinate reductase n=1 Tax=Palleronia sediminis TaxID=2547833 RepID=A0A4R5ZXV4_9RHOB|nr:4-hydroxy-tetrahydrodipicolinate reductase [Palleronia sediminis]TDL76011.1 4-hydroxy-tetrahydrodipicolinate reductase [Palleronia sediminis]